MHRFFVAPEAFERQPVVLTGPQAHQVRRVLRMRLGERAMLLDGRGWACEGLLIAVNDADVRFQVLRRWRESGEPRTQITLLQAVLKGERFGWVLQKGTEVGVSAFMPVICERNVVDDMEAVEDKRERWERIIQEAAEQSGRAFLPQLLPAQLFQQAAQPGLLPDKAGASPPLRLMLWEGERETSLNGALAGCNFASGARIQVVVGPEGGFTGEEVRLARSYGIRTITLGPRILRADTAGVVAAAIILHEAGEMGGTELPNEL
jgi:16S rRNA (uracil1498-N3)-methyltransferase